MANFQDHLFGMILQTDKADTNTTTSGFKSTPAGRAVAYSALVVMTILPIVYGSFNSISYVKKQRQKHAESGERPDTLSSKDAMVFPLIASVTLGGLYLVFKIFSKEYVNLLLSVYFFFLGIAALSRILSSITKYTPSFIMSQIDYHLVFTQKEPKDKKPEYLINFKFSSLDILALLLSSGIGIWYFMKKHWIANNIFGLAFACNGIEFLSLNKVVNGCILLLGLFFYDIFWVFGTDVMVTVARSFEAPIKLMFPQDILENGVFAKHHAMLGLGDIVVPGIFIALLIRYDISLKRKSYTYFYTCLTAYILGLVLTIIVMTMFNHAQPALLYLVPTCLSFPLGLALCKGDLKSMFKYQDHEDKPETKKASKDK